MEMLNEEKQYWFSLHTFANCQTRQLKKKKSISDLHSLKKLNDILKLAVSIICMEKLYFHKSKNIYTLLLLI